MIIKMILKSSICFPTEHQLTPFSKITSQSGWVVKLLAIVDGFGYDFFVHFC